MRSTLLVSHSELQLYKEHKLMRIMKESYEEEVRKNEQTIEKGMHKKVSVSSFC